MHTVPHWGLDKIDDLGSFRNDTTSINRFIYIYRVDDPEYNNHKY
jgi:hypothetical protein